MGNCIICDHKTENQCKCYSADELDKTSSQEWGTTTTVKITYGNISSHQDYMCDECIDIKRAYTWHDTLDAKIGFVVGFVIFLMITIVVAVLRGLAVGVYVAVIPLICAIVVLSDRLRKLKKRKNYINSDSIYISLLRNEKPDRVYLSTEEYNSLLSNNLLS